jgi:type IV pilus assembly protein PilC
MPRFSYEVKQRSGQVERGTMAAETPQAVARKLQAEGYFVVSVERVGRPVTEETPWDSFKRRVLAPTFYPTSSKALATYFSSLRALLSTGMNVSEATRTLSQRTGSRMVRHAAREMAEAAIQGRPMSGVMRKYPSAFGPATLAAMDAAEQTGLIEQMADRLAKYFDRAFELEQTYRWQTFYPKVLLIAAVLIPSVKVLVLDGFGPWLSVVLGQAVPALLTIAVLWYGFRLLFRLPLLRRGFDGLKLMIPWVGSLGRRMATARWARSLAMLMAAGVPVHRALVAAASASGNAAMERALVREATGVLHGKSVTEVVAASRMMPDMALDMLATAERSGSVESALEKVAEYYESETDVGGKQTAIVVGVVAYLIIAAIIGGIVISFWYGYAQQAMGGF